MTIEAGGVTLSYEIRAENDAARRYELTLLYRDKNDEEALDRLALDVSSRRDVTKGLVETKLADWTADHPHARISEYAVLEIEAPRWGRAEETMEGSDVEALAAARHPRRLLAEDDDWDELQFDLGDTVEYSLGGQDSRIYGTETGEIVGTSGSGRTYWVEVDGEEKRIPEAWMIEEV